MSVTKTVVIVGASHAGISTAINIKKYSNDDLKVILLEATDGEGISFVGADGLLWIQGKIEQNNLVYTTISKIINKGIDLKVNHYVREIDIKNQIVNCQTSEGDKAYNYDYLVLATGSHPFIPDEYQKVIDSLDSYNPKLIQVFKTIQDAYNLKSLTDNNSITKYNIIGGGQIGIEVAEVLKVLNKDVTIYQRSDRILNSYYDKEFTDEITSILQSYGVEVLTNQNIELKQIIHKDSLTDGEVDSECATILALGFKPNSSLGDIQIKKVADAYKVNHLQQTNVSNIYAVGDCASSYFKVLKKDMHMAIGSNTRTHSLICAKAITNDYLISQNMPALANVNSKCYGSQGSNAISVFGVNFASTGITYEMAQKYCQSLNIKPQQKIFEGNVLANELQLPNQSHIKLKVVYDEKSMRILGAQMMSKNLEVNLIHLISLAINQELTVYDMQTLDMFFLPQLNQLYNEVARVLSGL